MRNPQDCEQLRKGIAQCTPDLHVAELSAATTAAFADHLFKAAAAGYRAFLASQPRRFVPVPHRVNRRHDVLPHEFALNRQADVGEPMDRQKPLLTEPHHVPIVTAETEHNTRVARTVATRDHDVIRHWAASRQAAPATGEATRSGPATVDVHDGDAGIRFNFPGFGRFRPISWEEWFDNFDRHELTFVYEEFPESTEQQPTARYRIVKSADWKEQIG